MTAALRTLSGATESQSTITAYRTDLAQFARFLAETNCIIAMLADIPRTDASELLGHLGGVTREWFRDLEGEALITPNPTAHRWPPPRRGTHPENSP